jgi:phosphatidate cytidylyltransferase
VVFYVDDLLEKNGSPSGLLMLILFAVLVALASLELCAIFRSKAVAADPTLFALSAAVGCMAFYCAQAHRSVAILATLFVVVLLGSLVRYSWGRRTQGVAAATGATLFALAYLGVLPGFYVAIRQSHSAAVIAAIIVITKSCDIGAYCTGRLIGRHKLIAWLSPGKTWEGLVGGLVLSGVVAVGCAALANALEVDLRRDDSGDYLPPMTIPLVYALIGGALIGVVGQLGDLVASLIKRDAGLKDSGRVIPAYGGLIDVFDSPLAVGVVAYWLLAVLA